MPQFYRGLILVAPHGQLISCAKKTIIVKSKKFEKIIGKPLLLIQDKEAYGIIKLAGPIEISLKEFRNLCMRHLITEGERVAWWKGKRKLYMYPITYMRMYKRPRPVHYPWGPQVFVLPKNIEFQKKVIKSKKRARKE